MKSKKSVKMPKPRGFAAMHPDDVREICAMGGNTVSADRQHMRDIGRKGGLETGRVYRRAKRLAAQQGKA